MPASKLPTQADKFSDEELAVMTYTELHAIAHGTLSYALIYNRVARYNWPRRQAVTQAAGGKGHSQKKSHPFRQYAPKYYSDNTKSKARAVEVKQNWDK